MTKYREIIRLKSLGISQDGIAGSCQVSKKTVNRVLKRAEELHIAWPLQENETDVVLEAKLFPSSKQKQLTDRRMPDFDYIQQELLRNGVNKKLLWTEYGEDRFPLWGAFFLCGTVTYELHFEPKTTIYSKNRLLRS